MNLLTNAVKFQKKGVIKIQSRVLKKHVSLTESKLALEVTVTDEGIGMTVEEA